MYSLENPVVPMLQDLQFFYDFFYIVDSYVNLFDKIKIYYYISPFHCILSFLFIVVALPPELQYRLDAYDNI